MDLKAIKDFLGEDWRKVEGYIHSALKSDISLLQDTNEAILSHSGKQLRPMLSLLISMACSGGRPTEDSCRYAAATELLHNATLLHDDVADDSDQRRGYPTIKSLMGPSVSVLVGDYWLVKSIHLILSADRDDGRVIGVFSKTLSDLAEGEMLQLQKAGLCDTDEDDYIRIIYSKTASLFVAGAKAAAISVDAPEDVAEAVGEYALALGLAFQIKDDIFDYSPDIHTGKPSGVDILEQKITMPLLGALASASCEDESRIRSMVRGIHGHPEYRDDIMGFVNDMQGLAYAARRLDEYIAKAVSALGILPDTPYRSCLEELAFFVGKRSL